MSRKSTFGQEMNDLPHQNSNAGLLNTPERQEVNTSSSQFASKFRDCLRQFRLQLLSLIFGQFSQWTAPTERRKVAMYKSRSMAAFNSLLHVIPLSGAITMLCLHWTWFYGGDISDDSTTLQFVAKFQELIMQLSIVDLILHLVRREAINGYVPLGALSGTMQATQLSYLWSLDFISVFRSPALHGWRKVVFVVVLPALLILTALVGPSSAVLMIPRPGTPHTEKVVTRYIIGSTESLYPSYFNQSNGLSFDFPSLSNTLTAGSYNNSLQYNEEEPYCRSYLDHQDTLVPYQRLLRFCAATSFEEVINSTTYSSMAVNATIPPGLMAQGDFYDIFGSQSFRPFLNGSISVTAAYPVVGTQCKTMNAGKDPETEVTYIQDNRISLGTLSNLSAVASHLSVLGERSTIAGQTTQYFTPMWTASPEANSRSVIGVFVTWLSQNNTDVLPSLTEILTAKYASARQTDLTVTTCTLSASWYTAPVQLVINAGPLIIQSGSTSLMNEPNNTRAITLNTTSLANMQGPEFHHQLISLNVGYDAGLATAFTVALSEYPASGADLKSRAPTDSDSTAVSYIATKYGWGYGQTDTATQLSLAVVIVYCIITVSYIAYSIITGHASTAWNSAIELVALALQSEKPDLGHVSVGIESLETLKKGVGIRASETGELQLVFASGREVDRSGLSRIKRNRPY